MRERLFAVAGLWNKDEDYEDSDVHQLTLLIEAVISLIQKKEDEVQRHMYQKELEKTVALIKLNESRLEALLNLNQMTEESEESIFDYVLKESVKLTRSESGFITLLTPEGKMKNMRVWSKEFPDSPRTFEIPVKYQDLNKAVWVEVIHGKKAVVVNDTKVSSVAQRLLPSNPPISRYMLIPITIRDKLIAVAGLGNKVDEYSDSDVKQITLLLENVASLIQKKKDEEQHQFYRRELEKSEKINALGILAGGIAHDFNNILTAVLGNISLAEMSDQKESIRRLDEAKKAILRSKRAHSTVIDLFKRRYSH